jgi:hypothetical protein
MKKIALALSILATPIFGGTVYTCKITSGAKLADYTLRINEEGDGPKARYDVVLKSGEKTDPPQELFSKGAVKIESAGKRGNTIVFSGESITLNLKAEAKTGTFIGTFRTADPKTRRKSLSGSIACE